MRKTFPAILLTVAAALALSVTSSASAQSNMGNTASTGSTIVTGVVESIAQDSVTIVQDSGERATILLAGHTVGKQNLTNGSRVRIDFRNNDDGKAVAEEIEIGAEAHIQVAVTPPTVAPRVEVETYRAQPMAPAPTAAPYVAEREMIAATPTTRPYDLPATGSQMPTVALLGLLALAGAVALRVAR